MADQNCNTTKIPSNEEIIDELTRDLKETAVNEKETNSTNDNIDLKEEDHSDLVTADRDDYDSEDDLPKKPSVPDDFVDEDKLKELDSTFTEEQKQQRRKEAADLKALGNASHKREEFLESIKYYTEALHLWPLKEQNERSILYSNRAASKIQLQKKEAALDDCTKALELNPNYVRAYLRRAKLYEETEKLDESLEDYKKILELDSGNPDALKATVRLPPLINERNEKLKTEMMGKLKDLGNMILRPFGLSTNNFQMQQDPNTGGYSINFQQNPNQ